jgi:chloramphenicol O-acetyltransferase type A
MSGFIDLDTWKRREHFSIYTRLANPFWSICADVDVTSLWEHCHQSNELSFSTAAIYLALVAVNETEPFRLRIRENRVWMHDRVDVSTTVLRADDTFAFAIFPMVENFSEFHTRARTEAHIARTSDTLGAAVPGQDNLIYHSTLPWIRFTAVSNPTGGGQDCIPRLVFGRCSQHDGRWQMPVAVEVHHGLVDGLDVARFYERFERSLENGIPPVPKL